MLNLQTPSPERWLAQVDQAIDELLIDHAHCEKKAAGTAMNLIFYYVDQVELAREMSEIVREELEHFNMVLDLLAARNIPFRRLRPSRYGARLHDEIRKDEPGRAVDRLLTGGIIEARSCERFALLRDHFAETDTELSQFFGGLFESEARYHTTYVRLAKLFAPDEEVEARLVELAQAEAKIIAEGEPEPRVHS